MASITITYRIKLSQKITEVFEFKLDDKTGDLAVEPPVNPPAWTALEYQQCSHCPLDKTVHPHCPVALQLNHFIQRFHDTSSIDEVDLEVITEERHISQTVPLQRAIGSMLGLVSPTCGCPKAAYMKPMARFHLPLSSEEETLFRVTGMFLLGQYLLDKNSRVKSAGNFSGLKAIYEELHILNKAIATRLRGATESDSSKNAIALLDMYSNLMPLMIDDHLPALSDLFSAYYAGPLPVSKPSLAGLNLSLVEIETPIEVEALVETKAPPEIKIPLKISLEMEPVAVKPEAGLSLSLVDVDSSDVPTLTIKKEEPKDKELHDLLNKKESVSELELLLSPAAGTALELSLQTPAAGTAETPAADKPKGRAVFKISDD